MMQNLFARAKKVMPGGVNSPVRSFKAVGSEPIFINRANGSKIYDVENNEYIDYVCSWGPMILGHNNPQIAERVTKAVESGLSFGAPTENEVVLAELIISVVPNIEMIRMVNSGTEAVMSALRLARAYTQKDKIIKFEGCYHGHCDNMLVKAGSGALTLTASGSLGVTDEQVKSTLIANYNDIESVNMLFEANKDQVAAVIIEPVAANMGVVLPGKDFLAELRIICDKHKALLIFDEVITGFRLSIGGAQEYFNIEADIVTFGKIIGGGMPVGAYAAKRDIMRLVAPLGGVYQAGTLSGNPIAMTAGITQLSILNEHKEIYEKIEILAKLLADGIEKTAGELAIPVCVNRISSLVCVFFTGEKVRDFRSSQKSSTKLYARFFNLMLQSGINLAPAQFEAMFISNAHTVTDIEKTLEAAKKAFAIMKEEGSFI